MPIIKSAKKALKRSRKLREVNLVYKSNMKKSIKDIKKSIKNGENEDLDKMLSFAYKSIDKAAKKNIIHSNNAARKKSRLTKMILEAKEIKPD